MSVIPPEETSIRATSVPGVAIESTATMPEIKVKESASFDRPAKKMRFDESLGSMSDTDKKRGTSSLSDHNANLAPCPGAGLVEEELQLEARGGQCISSKPSAITREDNGTESDGDTGETDDTEAEYYIEGNFDNLSLEQQELLFSAVDSYMYLPKTTLQKVYNEFNGRNGNDEKGPIIYWTKSSLKNWFEVASNFYDHEIRLDLILDTLESHNNSDDRSSLVRPREDRRLKFCEKVAVRKYVLGAPANSSLELEEVDLKCEDKFDWTPEHLEVLETAVAAYKYFPKAIVKKVHRELRNFVGNKESCSKMQISNWLKAAWSSEEFTPVMCRVRERLAELRSKDPENEQSRISAVRVQFSAKVDVKVFGVNSPASTHVGDMSGEI